MYCMNCGRENPDDVKFCCFCGTAAKSPFFTGDNEKNLAENGQLEFDENEAPETAAQNPANVSVPVSPIAPVSSPVSANPYPFPQPVPISTQGVSPVSVPREVKNVNIPVKNYVPEEKQPVGRTFTLKHIIMCLASTAVCAIAAGIFAGLYFSVV